MVGEEGGKSWGTMLVALLAPRGWVCVLGSHGPGLPSRTSSLILGPSEVSVLGRAGVSLTAERASCRLPSSFRLEGSWPDPLQGAPLGSQGFKEEAEDRALGGWGMPLRGAQFYLGDGKAGNEL